MMPLTPTKLIVALDVPSFDAADGLIASLASLDVVFKVGYEALYGYGEALLQALERSGAPYFVDAKLHDIPRTAAAAMRALVRPHTAIVSVHALGGNDMMLAAIDAAHERADELGIAPPAIFAVSVLTSHSPEELGELGLQGGLGENVMRLAALARDARCAGVVCSVREVSDLKSYFGSDFATLCPGIRPSGKAADDQKRVATPAEAARAGADYVVVGRPIVAASDPLAAARAILTELETARAS